jgi:hypothetical protein
MNHLGGHLNITHTDSGVLKLLKKELNAKSFLDVGCGPAGQVDEANKIGFSTAIGIDGDPSMKKENIVIHDFCKDSYIFSEEFDLGWSCEFVEHVKEDFVDNFMQCFMQCKVVALTHAPPNTPGYHHVNCRTPEYWKAVFKKYGFIFDENLTKKCREASTMRRDFFRKNGLVFKKETKQK